MEQSQLPRGARAVLAATALAGVLAVVVLLTRPGGTCLPSSPWLLVAPLVVVALIWMPFELPRSSGGVVVSLEPGVLVYLLLVDDVRTAASVWLVGVVLGQALYPGRRALRSRLFNITLAPVAAAAATLVVVHLSAPGGSSPVLLDLATTTLALLAFVVVDLALSALLLSQEVGARWLPEVRQSSAALAVLLVVGSGCIAFQAVVVTGVLPGWALAVVLVPLFILLALGRVLTTSSRRQWRSAKLYEAATVLAGLTDPAELEATALHLARTVMDHGSPELRTHPPDDDEAGVVLQLGTAPRWLVARTAHRPASAVEDARALQGLAALVGQAQTRLLRSAELGHAASHDALTGLANRRLLVERVSACLRGEPLPLAAGLLLVDLDDFKGVNDSFGHTAGDDYLREVAHRLRRAAGPDDLVARLGGNEFAVLVLDRAPGSLEATAGRALGALQRDVALGELAVSLGASIGATRCEPDDDTAALLTRADVALYAAKQRGKGTVAVFDEAMLAEEARRVRMLAELRASIDELQVHYQPVVDFRSGRVDGYEALVRWTHDGVAVPPSVFVELAEESGLIVALGRHVLEQVIADVPLINAAAGRDLSVAVNVSAHQLHDPLLPELVRRAVAASGGAALLLEMTERVLIGDDAPTLDAVQRLVDTGALLILDDFGAGYSAIGYLRRLPIHGIKIDRSVVEGVDVLPRHHDLVAGLVALCGSMGISPMAEGIETDGEWASVVALGCVLGQGYLFARPQPLEQFLLLLRERGGDLAAQRATSLALPAPR